MKRNKELSGKKREILILFIGLGILVLGGLFQPEIAQGKSIVHSGPVLNVIAHIKPCIRMSLSTDNIYFYAGKGPGMYEPVLPNNHDKLAGPVVITVGCNAREWSIQCEATPLKENNPRKGRKEGIIPPSQLFIASLLTKQNTENKENKGYLTLEKKITILKGSAGETKSGLWFKLKTTWGDRAGTYTGKIRFTCMMNP